MNNNERIKALLHLETTITALIHEEIKETMKGRPRNIIDKINYILDESSLNDEEGENG